ncbi:MAG: HD domain-containing protein [Erysipelotrichaceae bacterium]|nr:HD domain-containing protein [Erysipelotrichaceae bacterium]
MNKKVRRYSFSTGFAFGTLFIFSGIVLNLLGSKIAVSLNLPLFLDSIGTILVSAMSGIMPGVVVGFLSNMINGLVSADNVYYGVLNVLIAVVTGYYASRGYFQKLPKALLLVFPYSLIGGALGSVITSLIYGFGFGEGISAPLAHKIYEAGGAGIFISQLIADMLIDIADKFVTIIIVYFVLKLLTKYFGDTLEYHPWHQKPLSKEDQEESSSDVSFMMSLRSKILLIITAAVVFIALVTAGISFMLYHNATVEEHTQLGVGVSKLIASVVDGDKVNDYIKHGEAIYDYKLTEDRLEKIRGTSDDILYVYVYQIKEDGCHVVFDLDTEDTPGGEPGDLVEFDEAFMPYYDDLINGRPISPIVSDETFGWLLTMYEPVIDSFGVTQAYACVDISMSRVTLNEISFLTKVVSLFFGFFIVIVTIGLWLSEYNLVLPINTMAMAARRFANKIGGDRQESVRNFKELQINTGDEIENLYESFSMTIEETVKYIADVQKQALVINKMQNGLILVLADMVESRDQCTGDHVRKTAAYCRLIMNQLRKDGEFSDVLSDEYIEDVVNSAPLHDIGKIKVPDAILNKPGRLTDEEFEEIKKHTLAGNEIIQQAMELVSSDSSYLKEAKNLATYHHEKWNGKGYPMGISGDDIPLSARIMAVADVFDALVSRRSYKEPYSFEKAMEIIEEGSGNHFDPRIVKAFKESSEEARKISETFMGVGSEENKA